MKKYIVIFLALVPSLGGAAPNSIRFQGRLTDAQGKPIVAKQPDDGVKVKFELYSSFIGGSVLWQGPANQTVQTNDAGLFSVDLGPVPMNVVTDNNDLYLQVSVNDGVGLKTLSPRQKLSSVPYAMRSEYAVTAATAMFIADGSITSLKIQNSAIKNAHLSDRSVTERNLPAGYGLVPPGGIILSTGPICPDGYSRFTALDGRFPMGPVALPGQIGGTKEITGLSISTSGAHSHPHAHAIAASAIQHQHLETNIMRLPELSSQGNINNAQPPFGYGGNASSYDVRVGNVYSAAPSEQRVFTKTSQMMDFAGGNTELNGPIPGEGVHAHDINSDGSWLPPYVGILFCQKD